VGNTETGIHGFTIPVVHPHVRGEHRNGYPWIYYPSGSSPRAWGTRARSDYRLCCCAVHPHVRGEHSCVSLNLNCPIGSSPRAWGTR